MITRAVEVEDARLPQNRILLELVRAIGLHESLEDLLKGIAGHLHTVFDFEYFDVSLYHEDRAIFSVHLVESPQRAGRTPRTEWAFDSSLYGKVFRRQEPFNSPDIAIDPAAVDLTRVFSRDYGLRSLLVVPITTAKRRMGVITLGSENPGAYDHLDSEFTLLLAAQIAVAVKTQCFQHKLQRERDRSELLLEINNLLVSNLNLQQLLAAISACLRRVIPHDLAGIALYDETQDLLRSAALEFPSNEDLFIENEVIPMDGNPAAIAVRTRLPVICDPRKLESSNHSTRFVDVGVKSSCTLPLLSRGRVIGVLGVASLGEDAFTQEDSELLGLLANQVAIAVENALAFREIEGLKNKLAEEKLYLEEEIRAEYNFEEIIGSSPALRRVLQDVETVGRTDSTVMIFGETGTGKELIARAIHNLSPRRERTLVKVNCGAIPTGLLESEMFGHERGAFTGAIERRIGRFELAHQGTIFLDEVEDIPLELQPKLLRVLQEQEFERLGSSKTIRVDVRVVAATNVDLSTMVAEKRFRSDLYYRLNVVPIHLPPLRERREDIPMLVHFFANKFAKRMKKPIERIPKESIAALAEYNWPGNIRELQNLIERAVTLSRGRTLEVPLSELKQQQSGQASIANGDGLTLEEVEREHIMRVLRESNWVIGGPSGAASRLGLPRTTLNSRMRSLGISRPRP